MNYHFVLFCLCTNESVQMQCFFVNPRRQRQGRREREANLTLDDARWRGCGNQPEDCSCFGTSRFRRNWRFQNNCNPQADGRKRDAKRDAKGLVTRGFGNQPEVCGCFGTSRFRRNWRIQNNCKPEATGRKRDAQT